MATYVFVSGAETNGISPKLRGLLDFDSLFGIQATIDYHIKYKIASASAAAGGVVSLQNDWS